MKKIVSIFLLSILLFNWFGYRLLIAVIEKSENAKLEAQLDNDNYEESELISIKIPVTYLPYYNNSASFERVDGQVEIEGTQYKYVKRRIYNDSLELLCIPNSAVMKLCVAKDEYFKFINDLHGTQTKNENQHSGAKNFSVDYYNANSLFKISSPVINITSVLFYYSTHFHSHYCLVLDQPPENS